MPKWHWIYPNCNWHVPPEWYGLNFNSAFLTKVYWSYATHIVRVRVCSKSPINPNLTFTKKSNLHVNFDCKTMATLYDLLCYHSLTSTDPLFEELLSCLPTRFHPHIFNYIAYEHSMDEEAVHSIDSSVSAFSSNDSTYFFINTFTSFLTYMQLQDFHHNNGHKTYKRFASREWPTTQRRARRPYNTQKPPASASTSKCSRFSWAVQAGNSRSHCRRLKLVSSL